MFIVLLILVHVNSLFSQSCYLKIDGAYFKQTGMYLNLKNTNFINNGGIVEFSSGSNVKLTGELDQIIGGNNVTIFANLKIDKDQGSKVILTQNIGIKDTLQMINGYLDIKDKTVDFDTSGILIGETENSRVIATDSTDTEGLGTGVLKAIRNNPSGNVAGFGLNFTPGNNMGNTIIYRGHLRQQGTNFDNSNGGYSILRYYEIHPQNYTTIQINPFSYFDAELNNISPESDLKLAQLINPPSTWAFLPTTLNTINNTATGNSQANQLSYIKLTLAKEGCKLTASANIAPNPVCEGSDIVLSVDISFPIGNVSYQWSGPGGFSSTDASPIITNVTTVNSGTYYVTITDEANCSTTAEVSLNVNSLPLVTVSYNGPICSGDTLDLFVSDVPGGMYQWSGPNNFTSNDQNPSILNASTLNAGNYTVTVIDANGCSTTTLLNVIIHQTPNVLIGNDTTISIGNSIQLEVTGADKYTWQPTTYLTPLNNEWSKVISTPTEDITYCAIGEDLNGCIDTACIKINIDYNCGELYIPEAFSPDGDGLHDTWSIKYRCMKYIELQIYNRWGELVFETTDINSKWDGTYKGKPLNTDVFVFTAKIITYKNEEIFKKGSIILIR